MKNENELAKRNVDLAFEFSRYVLANPEIDEKIPEGAQIVFEVADDPELTQFNRLLKERNREAGKPVVLVRIRGLAPTRLLDPTVTLASV